MQEVRRARLQQVILEELSTVIAREVKDPRVPNILITSVEVSSDASFATVHFVIQGSTLDPDDQNAKRAIEDCIEGLNSASGFLRRHLSKALTVRHIPNLVFKADKGLDNASRVFALLKEISEE